MSEGTSRGEAAAHILAREMGRRARAIQARIDDVERARADALAEVQSRLIAHDGVDERHAGLIDGLRADLGETHRTALDAVATGDAEVRQLTEAQAALIDRIAQRVTQAEDDNARQDADVEVLTTRVDAVEAKAAVPGPKGEKGDKGDRGPRGPMGPAGFSGAGGGTSGGGGAGTVTSVTAGTGITVGGTSTDPVITNSGVNSVTAGTGVSVSGTTALTVTNTGVTSLTGSGVTVSASTGAVTVTAPTVSGGTGISVSGSQTTSLTVTNSGVTSLVAGTGISVSSATGAVTITSSGSGPTQVTFAEATAAPNATVYVDSITAAGASTDADLAVRPKGAGALTAHVADSTVTGGNKRGTNAVDWQTASRTAATQVASGTRSTLSGGANNTASGSYSTVSGGLTNTASNAASTVVGGQSNTASGNGSTIIGGYNNTSSNTYTTAGGNTSTASGSHATAIGFRNSATTSYSTALGAAAVSATEGRISFGSGNPVNTYGDTQYGISILTNTSSSTTPVVLWSASGSVSATSAHNLVNAYMAQAFDITVVARRYASGTAAAAYWRYTGLMARDSTLASTVLVNLTLLASDTTNLSGAAVAITANTTTGGYQITCTGLAATNIRWTASIRATETY